MEEYLGMVVSLRARVYHGHASVVDVSAYELTQNPDTLSSCV